MNSATEIASELSNGTLLTKEYWKEMVSELTPKGVEISIKDLRMVDEYYLFSFGKDEWHNVKRGKGGYEATRRAAMALAKLNNIIIDTD